jgi:hypothetical protein
VSDVHIFYFMIWDRATGGNVLFARPATLEAIMGRGEPVLESQMVVDHTDLDANGFLITGAGDDSPAFDDQAAQDGRDSEALESHRSAPGNDEYLHNPDSRAPRTQSPPLKKQHAD